MRLDASQAPTHFDGHQHVHVVDGIAQILAPLAAALGVMSTRLCMDARVSDSGTGMDESTSASTTSADRFGVAYPHVPPASHAFYARVCDDSARAAAVYRAHGIRSTAALIGLSTMGALMTRATVREALRCAIEAAAAIAAIASNGLDINYNSPSSALLAPSPPSVWIEFMTHPGHCQLGGGGDSFGDDFSRSADRQSELNFLRGADFRDLLASFAAAGGEDGGADITLRSWREFDEQFAPRVSPARSNSPCQTLSSAPSGAAQSKPIRILFLSPMTEATGNRTTAMRLCRGLERCGHAVTMVDSTRLRSDCEAAASQAESRRDNEDGNDNDSDDSLVARHACRAVDDMCASGAFDLVFALHAYRSARFLLRSSALPLVVVLGGTDTVLHRQAPAKVSAARLALRRAARIVAFNAEMKQLIAEWCDAAVIAKTDVIAPSFALATADAEAETDEVADDCSEKCSSSPVAFSLRHWLECVAPLAPLPEPIAPTSLAPRMRVLLLIAGLRPVKDVAFLFDAVREWHRRDPRIRMVRQK